MAKDQLFEDRPSRDQVEEWSRPRTQFFYTMVGKYEPLATLFHLINPRFEPQTSRSRGERVTARPTALHFIITYILFSESTLR